MQNPDTLSPNGYGFCPHCLAKLDRLLPLEPLYEIEFAAAIIPQTYGALRNYLSSHKEEFPPRYRITRQRHLRRLLSATEIRLIRSRLLRFKGLDKKPRPMSPSGT